MVTSTAQDDAPAWLNERVLFILVAIVTISHLVFAALAGPGMDESYYTLWSEHLSVAYLDHPPMVAYIIAAGRTLFGDTLLGMRFVPTIMIALTALATWRIGVLLFSRFTAAVAVLLMNFIPVQALAYLATPDAPCLFFCAATLWAVAEFVHSRKPFWWIIAGVFIGLALWSKYTALLVAGGLVLFLFTSRERLAWLKLWQLWAGGVVSVLVYAPVLIYNATHDWIPFRFQGKRTIVGEVNLESILRYQGELIYGYLVTLGPAIVAFALAAIVAFFVTRRREDGNGLALLVWTTLPGLAYFVVHALHGTVQAHWPLPLAPGLTLLAAWMTVAIWRRVAWVGVGATVLNCALGILFSVLLVVQVFWQPVDLGPYDRSNELRGWPELFANIESVAKANGARTISLANTYETTGELSLQALFQKSDILVRAADDPVRWLFMPPIPADALAAPSIFITLDGAAPPEWVTGARLIGEGSRVDTRRTFATYQMYLVDTFPVAPAD